MVEFDMNEIKGLTQDSRAVKKGYLFAALPGSRVNGCDYIEDAVRNGARAILMPADYVLPESLDVTNVALLKSDIPRKGFAHLAAQYFDAQPGYVIAVTGTNGKTSTVTFAQQIWQSLEIKSVSLGTLGLRGANEIACVRTGAMTTPDTMSLHAELADLAAAGVTHLAMEASSHGLDQYRLDGVQVKAAGFTNLSRDHLDYHGTEERYFNAKQRLFSDVMEPGGACVLNADIKEFKALEDCANEKGHRVLSYGHEGRDFKILSHAPTPTGQELSLEVFGKSYALTLPLVGHFQLMNVLCALGLVVSEFLDDETKIAHTVSCLGDLKGVKGRLQLVPGHPENAAVYVDYAHTPDALLHVLQALRPHTGGRLICLFGCGGDRDQGKRSIMGQIAQAHADIVIVTDDNPRSEDPAEIRKDILAGAENAREISGRDSAILDAVAMLGDGDVLVIAGKGHEQGQVFDGYTIAFDDVEQTEIAIQNLRDK